MKRHHASFGLCVGFALILVLGIVPTIMAADPPIVGNWEGTLDPGAQPKKRIVVHITAAQDGSLNGTIDYPDESSSGALITAITYKEPALHFESTSGQGSNFWFTAGFEKQAEGLALSSRDSSALTGLRMLIVDDSSTARRSLLDSTSSWGMLSVETETCAEALAMMRAAVLIASP